MSGLTMQQITLLNYLEQIYLLDGYVPTRDKCVEVLGVTPEFYDSCYRDEGFRKNLDIRGIRVEGSEVLTAQQLAAINTIYDFNDTRSDTKKLKELGIPSQTWAAWKRDPAFQDYLAKRAENLLGSNMDEAHRALIDAARRGDVSALKLYYEMTGRWSSKTVGELNVEFLLVKIIEAVQKHVADSQIVNNIAEEIMGFAGVSLETAPVVATPRVLEPVPAKVIEAEGEFML